MKSRLFALVVLLCILFMVFSCQKEQSYENHASVGSLQSDSTGECLSSTISGDYITDSALIDTVNYISVQANITKTGTYTIASDTVNGIYFRSEGSVNTLGLVTFRVTGYGTPTAAGIFTINVTYGTTTCAKEIMVTGSTAGTTAVYTIENADGNCPVPTFAGTYMAGVATDAFNTLAFDVNVTTPGTYAFNILTDDGIVFTGNGSFTAAGTQHVVLQASGTPQTDDEVTVTIGNCDFTLTVVPNNLPDAVYTLNCDGLQVSGTYTAGVGMEPGNSLSITATVTKAGKYQLTTTTVNGVTFYGEGIFTSASNTHTIVLTAGGTPEAGGTFTFPLSGNGASCSFPVTFADAPAPAVLTLIGAPNACTEAQVDGVYSTGIPLNTTNTVSAKIHAASTGNFTVSTNTVNGMTFTATGTVTQTGDFYTTLSGSGTPISSGTFTFTPQIGTSSCTFSVTVTDVQVATGTYTCKIDGAFTAFNDRAQATNGPDISGDEELYLDGFTAPANGESIPEFQIFITKTDGSKITTGTYDEKHFVPPGTYKIAITYKVVNPDKSVTFWSTGSNLFSPNPPFTIVVTSLTATRVKGTFSGKLTNILEGSTGTKTVTEGTFDLPIVP